MPPQLDNIIPLHRGVAPIPVSHLQSLLEHKPDLRPTRHYRVGWWAMPSAHAGRASHRTLLRGFGHTATIAIAALRDDWRSFAAEVRSSPASHALVAVLTIIAWTALLVGGTL